MWNKIVTGVYGESLPCRLAIAKVTDIRRIFINRIKAFKRNLYYKKEIFVRRLGLGVKKRKCDPSCLQHNPVANDFVYSWLFREKRSLQKYLEGMLFKSCSFEYLVCFSIWEEGHSLISSLLWFEENDWIFGLTGCVPDKEFHSFRAIFKTNAPVSIRKMEDWWNGSVAIRGSRWLCSGLRGQCSRFGCDKTFPFAIIVKTGRLM